MAARDDGAGLLDGRRVALPAASVWAIVAAIVASTAGAVWMLAGEARKVSDRIGAVEHAVDLMRRDFGLLTGAVDRGVSTLQATNWIDLLRAQVRAIRVDLPASGAAVTAEQLARAIERLIEEIAKATPNLPLQKEMR